MRKITLLLMACCLTLSLWAHDFEVDGIYYKILADKNNEVAVVYEGEFNPDMIGTSYRGAVIIPATVSYENTIYRVTRIGNAFDRCIGLTSVTIPNSVTTIDSYAFHSCSSLTSIVIPSSVTTMGASAFGYCENLTSVVWNAEHCNDFSYSYDYSWHGYDCTAPFYDGCREITSFTFGDSVQHIPANLCCGMSNLTSITIPNSVTSIGEGAFRNCSGLNSITIPSNVTSIGDEVFSGCSGLTSIISLAEVPPTFLGGNGLGASRYIPIYVPCGTVEVYKASYGWDYFYNIQNPLSNYSISVHSQNDKMGTAIVDKHSKCSSQISAIPNYGYYFTQWSDGVTDNPRTLEVIQDTTFTAEFAHILSGQCGDSLYWSFDNNTLTITGSGTMWSERPWRELAAEIQELILPLGLTNIPHYAFSGCNSLTSVIIPSSVISIGIDAFNGCKKLYDIYCYASEPPMAYESSFANYNVNLYVPCDNLKTYQMDAVFGSFKYIQCIESEDVNTNGVVITPSTNDVTITWPAESNAETYTIVIKKGNDVFCTLTFNANGQLLNIAFAPSRDGSHHPLQYAEQAGNGYRFTVTGLDEGICYTYNIDVKDAANKTIKSYSGEFITEALTAVENTYSQLPVGNSHKTIHNGQLLIVRNGKTYNAQGILIN